MKIVCPRCGVRQDESGFYPDAAWRDNAWCKGCINKKRAEAVQKAVTASERLLREQDAILAVIDGYQVKGQSFVYLIEHADAYKIGYSSKVSRRVRAFNTAHSRPAKVLVVAPGGSGLEAELHAKFDHFRIAREWFGRRVSILHYFRELPGAMVFVEGHVKPDAPPTLAVHA